MWNLGSLRLETVSVSVQDWCMVCARRTIGLEIVLDAPNGTLGNEAQVKARSVWIVLILTQDRRTVCVERTIGS